MLRPELLAPARKIAGTIGACLSPKCASTAYQVLWIVARYSSEKRLTSQGLDMPAALGGRYLVGREAGVAELLELLAELL